MRLAQIVEQRRRLWTLRGMDKLRIPEAFRRMLGLYENSDVFCLRIRHKEPTEPTQMILTTIPPLSWRTVLRFSVLLKNEPGQLLSIVQILSECGINILLMEGYGYLPEKEGRWSAVIDFPSLHREVPRDGDEKRGKILAELKAELRDKVQFLLARMQTHYSEAKVCDSHTDEASDLGGCALITQEGVIVVRIVPMRLQTLADSVVEELNAVAPKRFYRNTIDIDPNSESGRIRRHLLMCNTEEHFIRMVKDQKGLAEVDLEVHTKATARAREGVGVLESVAKILTDFEIHVTGLQPRKGVNIAFTYNYITTHKSSRGQRAEASSRHQARAGEASMIKLYLELDPDFSPQEQRRIWKDLFANLLNARRNNDEMPFVELERSQMVVWQQAKKILIIPDKGRQPKEIGLVRGLIEELSSSERATSTGSFILSLAAFVTCASLTEWFKWLEPTATALGGISLLLLLQMLFPRLKH